MRLMPLSMFKFELKLTLKMMHMNHRLLLFLFLLILIGGAASAQYQPRIGRMVSLKVAGGPEVPAFEAKTGQTQGKIILMFHDRRGLDDQMKKEAERLMSEAQATVLALDIFERKKPADSLQAEAVIRQLDEQRVRNIIQAGLDYAGKFARIQTVGWGTGGAWSLQAAIMAGQRGYGCVVYYGKTELDTVKFRALAGPVMGCYGKKDKLVTSKWVSDFGEAIKAAGKEFSPLLFEAGHGFAQPGTTGYNPDAARKAGIAVVEFLKKNFETPFRKPTDAGEKE